jgi:hypothetical protein
MIYDFTIPNYVINLLSIIIFNIYIFITYYRNDEIFWIVYCASDENELSIVSV